MKSRRQFIKLSGAGILAAGATSLKASPGYFFPKENVVNPFHVGMAGYTFLKFTIPQTIAMMKRIRVTNLSVKDFHMPYDSTKDQILSVIKEFKDAGISVYTVGVVYMKSQAEVDRAFEYARTAGVKMIVGAPNYELLPYVEKKVKEYDFRLAIHNHGPDNPLYPNATDIWNHVKDMDPRMGICLDIGHTTRDGHDPSEDLLRYKTRIFDLHVKDVDRATKEGSTVEMGRGIIDIPKVVKTLREIDYTGCCSLEFEKDMDDPLPGIAESIGYFRGVMAC
jgi:inosose dehydratase